MKQVAYSRAAARTMRRLPADVSGRIDAEVKAYAADPESLANNIKALSGRGGIRLRIGDWRVIVNNEGRVLHIVKIGPRGSVYD